MLGRSLRHVTRSLDTIITVTIMPIAFLLLFVYVFGGAIQAGTGNYVNYLMPGILLIAIASGVSYTGYRLFNDMKSGIFERFHSMPIARSSVLWGHVLTSLVSNAISVVVIIAGGLVMGFRYVGGSPRLARGRRDPGAVHPRPDLDGGDRRAARQVARRSERVLLPDHLPAVHQLGVRPDRDHARSGTRLRRKPACDLYRQHDPGAAGAATGRQRHLDRAGLVRRRPAGRPMCSPCWPTGARSPDPRTMNRPPKSTRAAGSSINPHDHSYIKVFTARFGRGPGPVMFEGPGPLPDQGL